MLVKQSMMSCQQQQCNLHLPVDDFTDTSVRDEKFSADV